MRTLIAVAIATPIVIGAASFGVTYFVSTKDPRIDVPSAIDVGSHEAGRIVKTSFFVRNRGRQPLVLNGFGTTCGCLTVERKTPEGSEQVSEVTVQPGESVELVSGLVVRGNASDRLAERLTFHTNDPHNPLVALEVTAQVEGSLLARPSPLHVGRLLPGDKVTSKIIFRDTGRRTELSTPNLRISNPECARVLRFAPADPSGAENCAEDLQPGRAAYEADVEVIAPRERGTFRAQLDLIDEGNIDPIATVTVMGTVVGRYALTPESLVLPRYSDSGLVYSVNCLCRSHDGGDFELQPFETPDEVSVSIHAEGENKNLYVIAVKCHGERMRSPEAGKVTFKAIRDGRTETLELPVKLVTPEVVVGTGSKESEK
jgi:hypothetical protein